MRVACCPLCRRDDRDDLVRLHRVAGGERLERRHRAGERRGNLGLHLHRADDEQGFARGDAVAFGDPDLQDGSGHGAGDGVLAGLNGQFGRCRRRRDRGAGAARHGDAHHRRLPPQQREGAVAAGIGGGREQLRLFSEKCRPRFAGADGGVGQDRLQLIQVGGETADVELVQCSEKAVDRGDVGGVTGTERRGTRSRDLGEQRVELGRRRIADVAAAVDAYAGAGGLLVGAQRSGAARDHPGLDGGAARCTDRALVAEAERGKRGAGGDPELRLDEVDAGDLLGDRMFDLNARVALDEEVLARLGDDKELHRACVGVARCRNQLDRVGEDAVPQRAVQRGRRRRLDDLLVAQLDGAVPLVQVDDVAVPIGEHLDFDVARPFDQLLDEHGAAAESGLRLAPAAGERLGHRAGGRDPAHAATAAAGGRLEHHGIAEQRGKVRRVGGGRNRVVTAGNHGNVEGSREPAGAYLVAEQRERGRGRSHEDETGLGALLRERGAFRQEAVSGVDAVAAAPTRRRHERLGVEIGGNGIIGNAVSDLDGRCREAGVKRQRVRGRIDAHRFHAERRGGLDDADGDLAAVADQDPFELRHGLTP